MNNSLEKFRNHLVVHTAAAAARPKNEKTSKQKKKSETKHSNPLKENLHGARAARPTEIERGHFSPQQQQANEIFSRLCRAAQEQREALEDFPGRQISRANYAPPRKSMERESYVCVLV